MNFELANSRVFDTANVLLVYQPA